MPEQKEVRIEELKPKLIDEIQFIELRKQIVFLKNGKNNTYLKLKKEDADLVRGFNGTQTLSDILRNQLEINGTTQFQRIFFLLVLLNENGLLASDTSSLRGSNFYLFRQEPIPVKAARIVAKFFVFDLVRLRGSFRSPLLQKIASAFISIPGLLALLLVALANVFIPSVFKDVDISEFYFHVNTFDITAGLYFFSLLIIWLSVCSILSFKNLISAYGLAAQRLAVAKPRLRFFAGLVYFDFDASDVIRAGTWGVARFYGFRILLPFTLMSVISLLSMFDVSVPFFSLVKAVCMFIAGFSISPLANTDMNKALGILTASTHTFSGNVTFLRRKYLSCFLNFKSLSEQGLDFTHIMASLTVLWLIVLVLFVNFGLSAITVQVLQNQLKGFTWNTLFIFTQVGIMIAPLVVQVAMTLSIVLSNIQVILTTPMRRITNFAESLSQQMVPAERETVNFLKEIPLFAELSESELKRLCTYLKLVKFGPQSNIIVQGEMGDAFYLIVSGLVAIEVEDGTGRSRIVDFLMTGHSFGEIALIENVPRTATARSISPVNLFVLHRKYFNEFVRDLAGGTERITDFIRTSKLLMASPLFSSLPPSRMRAVIARFQTASYGTGDVVFGQGDPGDRVYMVKEGQVEVRRIEEGKTVFTKTLGRGDWFGEIALVKNMPRTATVRSMSQTTLLSLSKKDFYDTMQHSLMTGIEFNKLADERLGEVTGAVMK